MSQARLDKRLRVRCPVLVPGQNVPSPVRLLPVRSLRNELFLVPLGRKLLPFHQCAKHPLLSCALRCGPWETAPHASRTACLPSGASVLLRCVQQHFDDALNIAMHGPRCPCFEPHAPSKSKTDTLRVEFLPFHSRRFDSFFGQSCKSCFALLSAELVLGKPQRTEYSNSCWLADGCGNSGDRRVGLDETFILCWQTKYEFSATDILTAIGPADLNQADEELSAYRGAICELRNGSAARTRRTPEGSPARPLVPRLEPRERQAACWPDG